MAGPAERIAWQDFLLLAGSAGSEKNGTRKCAVKTLDTVFIDPETHQPNWFFTTKSGCISRKKPDSVTLSSVADRFARFSLANPSNFEQLVGKYFSENGSRQPLKQEQLVQLLEKDFGKLLEPGSFLQVYLRPRKGNDVVYLCKSSRAGGKGSQDYKHLLTASKSHSEVAELTAIVEPQAHAAATAVAKFFADSKSMAVLEAELEFIVDDNDHVWLSRVAHMVAQFEPDLLDNSQTAQMKQASFNEEKSAADVISKKDSPDKSRSPTTKTPTSTDSRTSKLPPTDRKNNQAEKTLAHDSSAIEVKGIEDQSPDQEMSVASASSRALQPKGDNVKKKKKDVVKHEKKKSKLDEPPSFELLAKFAAERDRQRLLLEVGSDSKASTFEGDHKHHEIIDDQALSYNNRKEGKMPRKGSTSSSKSVKTLPSSRQSLSAEHNLKTRRNSLTALIPNEVPYSSTALLPIVDKKGRPANYPDSIQNSEKRLSELEKLAATTSTINAYVSTRMSLADPLNGGSSTISGTEADFLVRQVQAVDPSHMDLLDDLDELQSFNSRLGGASVQSMISKTNKLNHTSNAEAVQLKDKVVDALKERVAALEKQCESATAFVKRKETELEQKDHKLKRLIAEMENLRRESQNDLKRMQSEHEIEVLRIREQHSKEKASLATATNRRPIGEENSQYRSDISSIGNLSSAADDASAYSAVHASTYEANSKLLEQIESLRREYKKSQESFADERRSLQIDYSNKMLTLERRLKAEIVELKASNSLIEDRLGQSAEELVAKQAEIERLVTENIGLEASKQQALDGQNKLRADIKNMQQSVQASYRLEASQGLTTGVVDPATAIRLNDAKNEAKNRQLVNKVEFLKSQLEAEKKAADDARAAMEQSREKLEEIREEFKYRMVEAEASKKNAVAEAEQQLESYYEERMQELTTLQARFMSMQSQLQDAQQESILAKQREESIKTVNNKALAHQAALRTEMDQLRLQLEDVKNERDRELANQSNKQSADATIRRLDNERQYLKSQLASEITHKNEVQNALTRSQLQLSDVQRQWKDDVDTLKDTLAAEERLRQEMEQKLDTMEKQSSTESMRLQSQNKELKEAFVKIRDQLRMEQLACENARTNGRRLQENLDDASKEIRRLQETEQQNELLHQEQLAAMTATLKQQEEDGLREVMKLKDELTKEYLANSQAQRQVMECADRFANEKKFIDRNNRTNIMGEKLNKYRLSRLAVAFRTWSTTNTFMGVAIQFREQVEELLQRNTEELNLDKAKAVDELRRVLGRETDQKLAAMQGECERAMADGLANAELNKQMELDNANAEYMRRLEDADNSFHSQLDGARRIAALELQQAVDKKNIQIQQLLEDHREANELALQEAAERIAQAQMEKEKEMNELWEAKIAQLESSWKVLRDKILEEAERNHEEKLERQKKQFLVEQRQLKELADKELRKSLAKAKQQYERDLEAREVAKNAEMTAMRTSMLEEEKNRLRSYRAEMHEATEQRIRELRGLWQNELDAMNEQKRKEFEDLLEVKMEEYAKSTEADRRKAIKLEASKWRQALKDAEQNHELELVRMKAETSNEKEKERLQELEIANNKFAWQRQQDLNQHEANMEEQRQQFRKDLEKLEAHHEEQLGERQLQTEARMKEQLDTFWTAKMKQEIADVESNWKKKLERERDRLESFKQDVEVHKQQMAEERTYLQSRINKSEELIRQIDELGRAEVVRAMKEFEEQKQAMETQFLEEKKAMEKRFQQSQADLTNQINEEHAQETGRLLEEERKIMNEELERQMSQVQEESERLISGLENAIAELRKEKGALSLQLETLSGKLEDTEDALFDSQQELKNAMKSQSLTSWKASAKMMIMKERFQKGMTDFDREAQKRYESVRREMQSSINDCTLTIMKLAVLMHNVERNRVTTQTTIANYKTAELAAKRNKIQLLEKDLERVTMEKDSLDEQKDLVEGEIDQLEQLVREVEDQLREHNRTSSMTNGRINVAHARKKRRLDSELERMLDSIEQKRVNILQLEERISDKAKERDDKEMEMKELEKSLVQILLEQQKQIYTQVDAVKLIEDQCKLLINVERLPWPPPENPTLEDVHQIVALREREQDGTQSRTIEEEQQTAFNTNANTNDGIAVAGDSASMAGTNVIDKMKFPNQKASSRSKEKEPAQQKNSKKK